MPPARSAAIVVPTKTNDADEQREVEGSPRDRPRQGDFERSLLPFAGDRRRREADREHRRQDDRDRMDEAERDRSGQAEDVPAAELGELLGHQAAVHQRRELRAEARIDDRQHEAPDGERDATRARAGRAGNARSGGRASSSLRLGPRRRTRGTPPRGARARS